MTPPLCIIQARYASTRLPAKMLLPIGGRSLIEHAYRLAVEFFGDEHVVVAIPDADFDGPLGDELMRIDARVFAWSGDEDDVLGRFHACAHHYRKRATDEIVRVTPDDFPIDVTRERFTLEWLDWQNETVTDWDDREHIGRLIPQRLEINGIEDYAEALRRV